jgi:exodeoxyribonuclease-3
VALHRQSGRGSPSFEHPSFDHETRIVSAELSNLLLVSTHMPNGGKISRPRAFSERARRVRYADRSAGKELVVCGDLNVAREARDVHPTLQKPEQIGQTPGERAAERILAADLVDVGRALDPHNENLFSWWAPWRNMRQRNIGWRLDYVLASAPMALRARRCAVLADVGTSDHAPVVAEFD